MIIKKFIIKHYVMVFTCCVLKGMLQYTHSYDLPGKVEVWSRKSEQ